MDVPRDKRESHERILAAAREEFMAQGFENASLRRIAAAAGLTAAALYRHFESKEALFAALADPAVQALNDWLESHIARCTERLLSGEGDLWQDTEIGMMRQVVYPRMEDYRLLLSRAQGTRYETFLHDLVEYHQAKMLEFLPLLRCQGYDVRQIEPKELHLFLSAYTTALFEPVIHDYTMEEALYCLDAVEEFFMPGWQRIMGF